MTEKGFLNSTATAGIFCSALSDLVEMHVDSTNTFLNADDYLFQEGKNYTKKLLARLFRKLIQNGKLGLSDGDVTEKIVMKIKKGGIIEHLELTYQISYWIEPISLSFLSKLN